MASRPLPDHGTYARANGSPGYRPSCYCEPCVLIKRKVRKRSEVNRQLGRRALVDAKPAREHLAMLHRTMSWASLAAATGIGDRALCLVYGGQRTRISRATHARITSVQPPKQADATIYIDATGTIRRIRALMAVGYSARAIADAADTTEARVQKIASGVQPTVRAGLAQRVALAYKRLAFRPTPVNRFTARARNRAASNGWPGPLAWNDDIDDPKAVPEVDEPVRAGARRRGDSPDPGRVMRLTDEGLSAEQIAVHLGVHKRTVVRARGRARTAQATVQAA